MNRIAIIITTFLRDDLLAQTIRNIKTYAPKNAIILIGDQNPSDTKLILYEDTNIFYYKLPYDCGLSYSRNFLVNEAWEFSCPYILMMADSIQFSQNVDFQQFINFLEKANQRGIIGFELNGSKCPWEFKLDLKKDGFYLDSSTEFIEYNHLQFKKVDICRNIFLSKTETLLNLWDNDMKLCEHELAFWNYKNRGYEVYWTDSICFKKVKEENNEQYPLLRNRFNEYRDKLKSKLGISGWVNYSPSAMREIRKYKYEHENK